MISGLGLTRVKVTFKGHVQQAFDKLLYIDKCTVHAGFKILQAYLKNELFYVSWILLSFEEKNRFSIAIFGGLKLFFCYVKYVMNLSKSYMFYNNVF
jgi:hypothetical protein